MAKPCTEPWTKFQGVKRIQAELKAIQKSRPLADQLSDITLVDDDLFRWRFRVKNFDEDVPAGRQLNLDLQECGRKYGQDYIIMEVIFPSDYPTNPFFLRVVSPRCVMYTGHVTAGGSICIEALVPTGGPGGWRPDYGVEGVLVLVLANMLHAEVALVRTPTGPGGTSGPLRVDLSRGRYCVSEYSMAEAQAAYSRTVANHGWSTRPRATAGAGRGITAATSGGGAGGSGSSMATAKARTAKALGALAQPNAAAAAASLAADQPPARRTRSRFKAAQAPAVPTSGASHGSGTGDPGPGAPVMTSGDDAVGTKKANATTTATAAVVAAAFLVPTRLPLGIAGAPAPAGVAAAATGPGPSRGPVAAVKSGSAAATGAPKHSPHVIVLDDDDEDEEHADCAFGHKGAKRKALGPAADRAAPKRVTRRSATSEKPESAVISVGNDDDDAGAGDVSSAAATAAAPTAAVRPRNACTRSYRDRVIMVPRLKDPCNAIPGHGKRRAAATDVVDLTSADPDPGVGKPRTRGGGTSGAGFSAAGPVGPIAAAASQPSQIQQQGAAGASAAGTADGVEVVDLTGIASRASQTREFRSSKQMKSPDKGGIVLQGVASAGATHAVGAIMATRCAAGSSDGGVDTVAGAAAQESADAAMAALLAQLEEARAKLEEEQRAKKRLEDKVQDLAAKALFAGGSGGAGGGAGPSSGVGPSGFAHVGGPSKPAAGGGSTDVLLSGPLPANWEPLRPEEGFGVKMVVLPLPGDPLAGTSAVAAPGSGGLAAGPALRPDDVAELVANGLSREDATDLLTHCNGNLEEAWELAMQAVDCGGIMALLKRQRKAAAEAAESDPATSAADTAAAKAARLQAELQCVLARFEKASGLRRSRVVRVERVQNWRLWTKYCIRRREIEANLNATKAHKPKPTGGGELVSGSGVNEFLLWHGTSQRVVELVVKDGFDLRESKRGGALGEGTYFAANASYSASYVYRVQPKASAAPLFGMSGMPGLAPVPRLVPAAPAPAAAPAPQPSSTLAFAGSYALMLCRVALGSMAEGYAGLRKPPPGADSVYMAGTICHHGPKPKDPTAAAKPTDISTDPAWDVGSALGDNLIVAVFDNAQAYPEYIVHFT